MSRVLEPAGSLEAPPFTQAEADQAGRSQRARVSGRAWPGRLIWLPAFWLVLAPLPLGSNRHWALMLLLTGVLLSLLLVCAQALWASRSVLAYLRPAAVPLLALSAYVLLVALQWGLAGDPGNPGLFWVTADRYQTGFYLLASLCYLAMFMLVLLCATDVKRLRWLMMVVIASGVLQALLAVVLLSVRAQYQFMWTDIQHGTQAIGSFVNRNHLAACMYLCLSLGIGLLLGSLKPQTSEPVRGKARWIGVMRFVLGPRMVLRLLLVVMVIALVLTRSRMGNTAFFVSMLVLAGLVAVSMPLLRRKAMLLVVSLLVVDMVVVGHWVGLERLMERIEGTAIQEEDKRTQETVEARLEPARRTLPQIADRPWVGHGGGAYYTSFTPYKTRDMRLYDLYFDHAHNDYAEIAADTGLIGLGLLLSVVLATLVKVAQLLRRARDPVERGMAYAGLTATVCLALHSMVDFNLQIPANAMTYTAILAMVWAAASRAISHPQEG